MALLKTVGKYIYNGKEKFFIKGIVYGNFPPEENEGLFFPKPETVRKDFKQIKEANVNMVRLYVQPPDYLMEIAKEMDLKVMLGLHIDHGINFNSKDVIRDYQNKAKSFMMWARKHSNAVIFSLGNEIPQEAVIKYGRISVEKFIYELYNVSKETNPDILTTFSTFPPTEFLELNFLDMMTFNIYIYRKEGFRDYLFRLQNKVGEKPLLIGEIGADSMREGDSWQAGLLKWKIRSTLEIGCAGAVVYTFCDGWWDGIKVTDWKMGIVQEDRIPKKAYFVVKDEFEKKLIHIDEELPKATVVIAAHNSESVIAECIESLLDLNYPNKEIIIVADGCTDETVEIAREYPVKVIEQHRGGLSVARNTGYQSASGEIVAYTDSDCSVDPDWLYHLVKSFDSQDVGAVGGPNLTPPEDSLIAQCVGLSPGCATQVLITDIEAEHVPGCNMAYRKSALEKVNGFDPELIIAADDVDMGWRMQNAGYTIKFHPGAQVFHHRRNSIKGYFWQQFFYGVSESFLRIRHPERFSGHSPSWGGRVYGIIPSLLPRTYRVPKIYFAPFPYIYQPPAFWLLHLPMSFTYYLIWLNCFILAALFQLAFPSLKVLNIPMSVLFAALGSLLLYVSLICCLEVAISGLRKKHFKINDRLKAFVVITLLSFIWPFARGLGQRRGNRLIRKKTNVIS